MADSHDATKTLIEKRSDDCIQHTFHLPDDSIVEVYCHKITTNVFGKSISITVNS